MNANEYIRNVKVLESSKSNINRNTLNVMIQIAEHLSECLKCRNFFDKITESDPEETIIDLVAGIEQMCDPYDLLQCELRH